MEQYELHNLLRGGEIRDNQVYRVEDGRIENRRFGKIELIEPRPLSRRTKAIYDWLLGIAADLRSDRLKKEVLIWGEDYEHNTDDPFVCVFGAGSHNFTLQTGNLVGFIRSGEQVVKITSRFGDDFLKYIIADADGLLEVDRIGGNSREDDYSWLLAYLWNIKFRKACRLGLPKTYESRRARLARPRGNLDPVDFRLNGESGRYACAYREHAFGNSTVSLLVAAYEKLSRGASSGFVREARPQYRAFAEVAAGIKRNRRELLAVPPLRNPFFADYNPVIDLSKQVLRQKGLGMGTDSQTSGFLFDVSMLFEYFIRKILKRAGLPLLAKSKGQNRIPRGNPTGRKLDLQPDLLLEQDGQRWLFDVKYKSFNIHEGVSREDLFQLHTYLGQFSTRDRLIQAFGLIYPMRESRWEQLGAAASTGFLRSSMHQQGHEVDFVTLFLRIPEDERDGTTFTQAMQNNVADFLKALRQVMGIG